MYRHCETKTQLGKLGLKPGGEPVAFVYWRRRRYIPQEALDNFDASQHDRRGRRAA
jgi:hypothetical protein